MAEQTTDYPVDPEDGTSLCNSCIIVNEKMVSCYESYKHTGGDSVLNSTYVVSSPS